MDDRYAVLLLFVYRYLSLATVGKLIHHAPLAFLGLSILELQHSGGTHAW